MNTGEYFQGEAVVVALGEVPEAPGPYAMSFDSDIDAMARSIERVGVLNRPVVERDEEGRIQVVVGYRRLMALKALQRSETPCTDLSATGLPFDVKLLTAFYDNLATRGFNDVEKGMALERLCLCIPRSEVVSVFMPLLGLPARETVMDILIQAQGMNPGVKLGLARKRFSLQTIRLLLDMDTDACGLVSDWLLKMNCNINYQREFIEYIIDISHRDGVGIPQVLSDEALLSLLHDERRNQPQKTREILDVLRHRRFPALSGAEDTFRKRLARLNLPPEARVSHSPGFESSEYLLEVRFPDGETLRRKLDEIADLQGIETLGDPWKGPS